MAFPILWNSSVSVFQLHKYARIASNQMSTSNMTQVSKGMEGETNKLSSLNINHGCRSRIHIDNVL